MDKRKGIFITLEGCEGVGKSTQLKLLKEYLASTGQEAVFTREPGGSVISEQIRAVLLSPENSAMNPVTEALLYAAARAQNVREVIQPAINAGKLVICDRFLDSSLAYQGYARKLGFERIYDINRYALDGLMPDYTVFIDLSPAAAFRSKAKSESLNDRIEHESAEFHEAVYRGYGKLADTSPDRFIRIIPQSEKTKTAESIVEALKSRGVIK
ncbi:MAG: dTMP kinase [Clostridiaceae bacterium]|jgi:dTMP kinase|nr:dTMP kinase [Clostridiaceae bacterium]